MTSSSNSPISRHIRVGKSDNIEYDDDDVYVHKHILFIKYCLTNSSLPYSTDTYCHAFVFVFVSLCFKTNPKVTNVKNTAFQSATSPPSGCSFSSSSNFRSVAGSFPDKGEFQNISHNYHSYYCDFVNFIDILNKF